MPTNTTQHPEFNAQFDQTLYDSYLHRGIEVRVLIGNTRGVLETSLGQDVRPEAEEPAFNAVAQAVDTTPQDGLDLGAVPGPQWDPVPQWDNHAAYPSFSGNPDDYELAA